MERAEGDARDILIAFDTLSSADRIWIQTKRSKYQFFVVDPYSRKGTLTGGFLGERILDAIFSGTISEDLTEFDSPELKTGARAVFFVQFDNQTQRLITSAVTDIGVANDCAVEECAA